MVKPRRTNWYRYELVTLDLAGRIGTGTNWYRYELVTLECFAPPANLASAGISIQSPFPRKAAVENRIHIFKESLLEHRTAVRELKNVKVVLKKIELNYFPNSGTM